MQDEAIKARPGLYSNAAFSLLAWAVPLSLTFLVTPFLLHYLGNEAYGYYAMVLGFLGFAFTTGVARVVVKYIPEFEAAGNCDASVRYAAFAFWLSIGVAGAQGAILAAAAPFVVDAILQIPLAWRSPVLNSLYLVCVGGPLLAAAQLFQSVLHARHSFRIVAVITAVNAVILSGGNLFLAFRGFGIQSIITWNVAAAAVSGLIFFSAAKRVFPDLSLRLDPDRSTARAVVTFAGSIVVYQAITSLLFVFERALVLRNLGAEALTFYVIPLMLAMYLHAFVLSLSQALIPRLNAMLGDEEALESFYRQITRAALAITTLLIMHYVTLGGPFLRLWLGMEFEARSYPILVAHAASFGLIAIGIVAWHTAEAFRKPGLNAATSVVLVTVAIFVMLIFVGVGEVGIAFGRVIGAAVTLPVVLYVERTCFGRPLFAFWAANAAILTIAAALIGFLQIQAVSALEVSWPALVLTAIAGTCGFLAAMLLTRFLSRTMIADLRRS